MKQAFVLVIAMLATFSTAQARPLNELAASVTWNKDSTVLLVSYRDIWAELADQDPTPLIRIFGDGRVLIHYPIYTPKAGRYELWLQPTELEQLLLSLLDKGVATFDSETVRNLKVAKDSQLRNAAVGAGTPELFIVSCDSTSVFKLQLTSYQEAGSKLMVSAVDQTISWMGLGSDAERYPAVKPIQNLRAAELELRALLERDNLARVAQ